MIRNIELSEISDGKLYDAADMAKLGVGDCAGCHSCCCTMGDTVVLDPYDIYSLEKGLGKSFEELQKENIDLRVVDGIVLPCLAMKSKVQVNGTGEGASQREDDACSFLNEDGRCSIHTFRPGFCRLFPLGRIYENDTHKYFIQVNECKKERQTKVKIKKWIGIPDFSEYEKYVDDWHYFFKGISERSPEMEDGQLKAVNMGLLKTFFIAPYDIEKDFYPQFYERMSRIGF